MKKKIPLSAPNVLLLVLICFGFAFILLGFFIQDIWVIWGGIACLLVFAAYLLIKRIK